MLAIVRALEEWRHFLEGATHQFEIWTNHKNLEYFRTAQKLNRRQARWSLYLSRFDFALHHRPGRSMGKPDALSRRADHGNGKDDNRNITLLRPELFAIRAIEGVAMEGPERTLMDEVKKGNRQGRMEEAVAKAWKALKQGSAKLIRSAEWKQQGGLLFFQDRIYVPRDMDLRRRIVELHHDTMVAGHPGRWKTLELVSCNYWWPQMSRFVGNYCRACDLCLRTKIQRRLPVGELHPLPIPTDRWEQITMDFIPELPPSAGYDSIMVVADSLSKHAHFIPTHTTVTSLGTARLFLHNVWRHHGLPERSLSDHGPQFISEFMCELYRLLGIQGVYSTAYHPQTDGQTERINQELEQFLRLFVNERQDNWHELLPLAEFAYNNHVHSSTQLSPFYLDTGRHPRMGFEPTTASRLETVNEFAHRVSSTLEEARAALDKAQKDMALYYNRRRSPAPTYEPGDLVYVSAEDITTTRPSKKLSNRWLGPWKVVRKVGSMAYRVELPRRYGRIHPVFPVVKLMAAPKDQIEGRARIAVPPPELIEGEEEYEVESILDSHILRRELQFLVSWKGYGYEDVSWERADDVHAPDCITEFYRSHPTAAGHDVQDACP